MKSTHNIISARYAAPEPPGGYADDAPVDAIHAVYGPQRRRANDDIDGGGVLAFRSTGGTIDPYEAQPITTADVQIERERRLALGFAFDFGDERGVHTIGTTDADMAGWQEVTTLAQARLALNDTTPIAVVSDTGPALVTPLEWMSVLEAAAAFRQPIWAGSFWLQAQDPIPDDYATNDAYWTSS